MSKTKVQLEIKKRRSFSEEFKKSKIKDLISQWASIILEKQHEKRVKLEIYTTPKLKIQTDPIQHKIVFN